MTQPVVTTDWIANRVIVSQRKKIWKCSRERDKCPSISRSWKSKARGEREATCVSARTTLNTLRRTSLCYGCPSATGILSRQAGSRTWAQDPRHWSTSLLCPWTGWVGLRHPKALQGPQVTKGFLSHTQKVQAEPPQLKLALGLLYAANASVWHQDDPEMRVLVPFLNCFGVPWRDMGQSHPRFCASCTNQILENTPWKVLLSESLKNLNSLFSFPRFKTASNHGLTAASLHQSSLSFPFSTPGSF